MRPKWYALVSLLVVLMGLLAACGGSSATTTVGGKTKISLWTHNAGNPLELGAVKKMVAAFNASQSQYEVDVQAFPQASYNTSVSAAALSHQLPCIMDLDNPTVANFAWSKYVQPLPITDAQVQTMGISNAAIGRYQGKIYALGQYNAVLVIFARKSVLQKYNIRIPTLDTPWTLNEFNGILAKLKSTGAFEYPFDMNPQSEDVRPLMIGMNYFFQLNTQWGQMMAYATLITLPVLDSFWPFREPSSAISPPAESKARATDERG